MKRIRNIETDVISQEMAWFFLFRRFFDFINEFRATMMIMTFVIDSMSKIYIYYENKFYCIDNH